MMILLHHHELVTIICSIAGDPCGTILEAKPVSLEEYAKALKLPKWQSFWNTGKVRLQKQVHHYPFGHASRCVPDTGLRSVALILKLHRHWKLSCWHLRDAVNCKCHGYLCSICFHLASNLFKLQQTRRVFCLGKEGWAMDSHDPETQVRVTASATASPSWVGNSSTSEVIVNHVITLFCRQSVGLKYDPGPSSPLAPFAFEQPTRRFV